MKTKCIVRFSTSDGSRNIFIELTGSTTPAQTVEKIKFDGGLWNDGSFFPYHAMVDFEIRKPE